jgi:hypothetical protein
MKTASILASIKNFYFRSPDFNGYPVYRLKQEYALSNPEAKKLISEFISSGNIDVVFSGNPHIRPFSSPSIASQLAQLEQLDFSEHFCLYPTAETLASASEIEAYRDRPYSLELACGVGQLEFRTFDLTVLEYYRNDPRYHYETNSLSGSISVQDKFYESDLMAKRDQILLQSFGFAYDDQLNRAVAVFVCYLSGLSPEHQRIWAAKELKGDHKLHPDYYRNCILGEWGTRIPIFDAFVEELAVINEMAELMQMKPLFRRTFKDNRPPEFAFLLRPTQAEFNRFVLTLDQMMSDNLNKEFFRGHVSLEDEEIRSDGKIIIKPLGTIVLLDRWLRKHFHPKNTDELDRLFTTFRKIRNLRQRPAHAVNRDSFDQEHFKNQRELILEAYDAVRALRMSFANHPWVKRNPPRIGKELFEGLIWDR